jgi:hypothetical protein
MARLVNDKHSVRPLLVSCTGISSSIAMSEATEELHFCVCNADLSDWVK